MCIRDRACPVAQPGPSDSCRIVPATFRSWKQNCEGIIRKIAENSEDNQKPQGPPKKNKIPLREGQPAPASRYEEYRNKDIGEKDSNERDKRIEIEGG